ncbi:DUF6049 family protein [Thermopolyspora sp. NPDC052614]|uniref:DUF6049 family protein n=1 Tax=Thermopolyspora sp. NPDC052614 TaxID=3155682 RepID=UPI003412D36B
MIRRAALIFALASAMLVPAEAAVSSTAQDLGRTAVQTFGQVSGRVSGQVLGQVSAPAPKQRASAAVQVTIDQITPQVPRDPTTQIKLTGTLANTGNTPFTALRVRLHFSARPFERRADMEAYVTGQGVFDPSFNTLTPIPRLDAGGKASFEVVTTAADLKMSRFGVYPLTVEIIDALEQQVAVTRTFMTYAPQGERLPRVRLAMAMPVIDQPRRADDNTFLDDGLHASLAGNGRLARLLRIAQQPHKGVTWFIDPAVLDDAQRIGRPYTVKKGDDVETRPADPDAGAWLAGLRTALAKSSVVATPYADPDITALVHNDVDELAAKAIAKGGQVAGSLLGRTVGATMNWPYGGIIDRDALDELAIGGVRTLLLNGSALPTEAPVTTTPDAATTIDSVSGKLTVLLADPTLSSLVDAAATGSGAAAARQRFIAETAMIAAEDPETTRTVIAAPRRRWDPDPEAVQELLATAGSLPWLRRTTLEEIKPPKRPLPRTDLVYSAQHRQSELNRAYLRQVRELAGKAELVPTVTSSTARPFENALLRLGSSAWRGRGGTARTYVEQLGQAVNAQIDKISITGRGQPRLLAGTNGNVGISVQNKLGQQVKLSIDVKSADPRRLMIDTYRREISIEAGNTTTIQVPMRAPNGGDTQVTVQLATQAGAPYGDPVVLTVSATGYTGIAAVIVGGALTVMLAAVLLRILRIRSNRKKRGAGRRREGTR